MFDTTCLTHFARSGRLADHPAIGNLYNQPWLQIVELDILETVRAAQFKAELGGPPNKHLGESEAMAIASTRNGVAVLDDADARRIATRHQIPAAGSLSLVARGISGGLLQQA